jgi:hypothetical protein
MDRVTDYSGGRWAAVVLGLIAGGAELGCARMNPFLRDEPPMLGTINSSTASSPRGTGTPGTGSAALAKGPTARPAPASDLYAQSFNRTQPRPATSDAPSEQPAEDTTPPSRTASASENGVRTTALDASSEAVSPPGVVLKPPVSLNATRSAAPAPRPSRQPSEPIIPQDPPATTLPGTSSRGPATLEAIVASARQRLDTFQSYQVAMNRQERVGDSLQAPEDVVLSIRRSPRAVLLQWKDGPHQGREVLFSEKETNGMLLVNMADSKIPVPRLSLPPDSPLALHNSRHPITEAGFDTILQNLQKTIEENKAGDRSHGSITYAGLAQPELLDHPCHKIVRVTASGETWQVFLDPDSRLPAMVQAHAANGDLLERYRFLTVQPDPAELAANAFNPDVRWGEAKGLLHRLARATQATGSEPATSR